MVTFILYLSLVKPKGRPAQSFFVVCCMVDLTILLASIYLFVTTFPEQAYNVREWFRLLLNADYCDAVNNADVICEWREYQP